MIAQLDKPERVREVRIGAARVGRSLPVWIMAEAGVNHDGSLDKALRMVDAAADCGVNAVKFQIFRAEQIVTRSASVAKYQQRDGHRSQFELLKRLELHDNAFVRLREHCARREVAFVATPFSPSDLERLRKLDPAAIKIASTDLVNPPLLRLACETHLPLIASTGAATRDEVSQAARALREHGAQNRLVMLHCVSAYPTPVDAANLRAIRTLEQACGVPAGFSDHTRSIEMGGWAAAAGACLLEKHFTLDRDAPGPDHRMSLEPDELRDYVASTRRVEQSLGDGVLDCLEIERDVRRAARKSVVAARELEAGTRLSADMLAIKRPGIGIDPRRIDDLIGRTLSTDVDADAVLQWDWLR